METTNLSDYEEFYDAPPTLICTEQHDKAKNMTPVAYDVMTHMIAPFSVDVESWLMQQIDVDDLNRFAGYWFYWSEPDDIDFIVCLYSKDRPRLSNIIDSVSRITYHQTGCFCSIELYEHNLFALAHELAHISIYRQSASKNDYNDTSTHPHNSTFYATMWGIISYWMRAKNGSTKS